MNESKNKKESKSEIIDKKTNYLSLSPGDDLDDILETSYV
jgi:hypothetical protein